MSNSSKNGEPTKFLQGSLIHSQYKQKIFFYYEARLSAIPSAILSSNTTLLSKNLIFFVLTQYHIHNDFAIIVFLSSFFKICENLWIWFEFIHYSFFVKNTSVSTMPLYTHDLVIKNGCVLCICTQFICVGQQGYKRFQVHNVRIYISNFTSEKYMLV